MEARNNGSSRSIDEILEGLDTFEILEVAHKSEEAGRLLMTISPHYGEYAFVVRIGKRKVSFTPLSCMGDGLLDHLKKICRTKDCKDLQSATPLTRPIEGTVEEVLTEKGRDSLYHCEFKGSGGRIALVYLAHKQVDSEDIVELAFINKEDMRLFRDVIVDQQTASVAGVGPATLAHSSPSGLS